MKTFLSLLLTGLCLLTFAQENKNEIKFGLNYDFNIESLSNNDLNNYFINKEYHSNSNILNNFSLGFSIRPLNGHSMIKVTFNTGESFIENSEDKSVLYSTGFGFDYLYDLIKSESWFIGPYIGTKLRNYKLVGVSKNLISTLTTKHIEESMQIDNSFLLNIGTQFSRKVQIHYLDLFVGLSGGYNINLVSNDWNNSSGQKLDNIPSIKTSGINVGFNLRIEFNKDHLKGNSN